jgi:hypothetical protein
VLLRLAVERGTFWSGFRQKELSVTDLSDIKYRAILYEDKRSQGPVFLQQPGIFLIYWLKQGSSFVIAKKEWLIFDMMRQTGRLEFI